MYSPQWLVDADLYLVLGSNNTAVLVRGRDGLGGTIPGRERWIEGCGPCG